MKRSCNCRMLIKMSLTREVHYVKKKYPASCCVSHSHISIVPPCWQQFYKLITIIYAAATAGTHNKFSRTFPPPPHTHTLRTTRTTITATISCFRASLPTICTVSCLPRYPRIACSSDFACEFITSFPPHSIYLSPAQAQLDNSTSWLCE